MNTQFASEKIGHMSLIQWILFLYEMFITIHLTIPNYSYIPCTFQLFCIAIQMQKKNCSIIEKFILLLPFTCSNQIKLKSTPTIHQIWKVSWLFICVCVCVLNAKWMEKGHQRSWNFLTFIIVAVCLLYFGHVFK